MVKYLRSLPFGGCVRGKRWLLEDVRRFLHFLRSSNTLLIPRRMISERVAPRIAVHSSSVSLVFLSTRT